MLILPSRELWTPEPREIWQPNAPAGRTRRRGGYIAPDRAARAPLYAAITRTAFIGFIASGTNASSYGMTMSVQPSSNRLQLVAVANTVGGSGTAALPSSVSGNGLTYANFSSITFASGTIGVRLSLWRALGTTTGAGFITVGYGATQTSCIAVANEFDGVDLSGTNGSGAVAAGASSNNGGASHNAGAFTTSLAYSGGSNNRPYVAVSDMTNGADWTALTNWTDTLGGFQNSPANNLHTFWRSDLADTTVGANHATNSNVGLLAIEIVAAAVASTVNFRRTLSNIGTRTGARQGV